MAQGKSVLNRCNSLKSFSGCSVADVYPGSRILIFTHLGSRIPDLGSRIPDPNTATKERGEKKFVVITF
jgi:hypothetical protein